MVSESPARCKSTAGMRMVWAAFLHPTHPSGRAGGAGFGFAPCTSLHIPAQTAPGPRGVARSFSPGSAPNPSHPWHRDPQDLAFPCLASLLLLIREAGAARAAPTSRSRLMGNRFPQCRSLGWGGGHTHPQTSLLLLLTLQPFKCCSQESRAGGGEQGWDPRCFPPWM